MSYANSGPLLIRLPMGEKSPVRLETQIRNGILSLMDITCTVQGPNTSLDAVIVEREPDHISVEFQACCGACAARGQTSIQLSVATD